MRILVSNDDGIAAPGLHQLADALRPLGEVYVCAPEGPRSGASSSLTLYAPLLVTETAPRTWSVSGNPADAVKLALHQLVGAPVDLVVSGINNGLNCGANVLYSGTVAAALEGAQAGLLSFAVSRKVSASEDFREDAAAAVRVVRDVLRLKPAGGAVYNINLPPGKPKGVVTTVTELAPYRDRYERRTDPRGRVYYWLRGEPPRAVRRRGPLSDEAAVAKGLISVTPLERDLTSRSRLAALAKVFPSKA